MEGKAAVSDSTEVMGPKAKRIILCADGTGNSGGKGYPTNVWRLFNAVDLRCHEAGRGEYKQIAFYDDGVGTDDFKLFKLIGAAFGYGLSRNIRELYETLARNYEPGDEIYVFGFSRGAFTARSLAGLIAECGVVDLRRPLSRTESAELRHAAFPWRTFGLLLHLIGWFRFAARNDEGQGFERSDRIKLLVGAAFSAYRERHKRNSTGSPTWAWFQLLGFLPRPLAMRSHDEDIESFKRRFSVQIDANVACVGVWDTVGALGAPANWMRAVINWLWSINFHDQGLHRSVKYGFHALAIDDERSTFKPILWNEAGKPPEQTIEQVWFAGVHSNVGGGYPKQGLASVSLYWMLRRAQRAGLLFQAGEVERVRAQANVHDKLYDSRAGLAAYYSYAPRDIAKLVGYWDQQAVPRIHYTVFERIASGVQDYVPANLPSSFVVAGDNAREDEPSEDDAALDYWRGRLRSAGIVQKSGELESHWCAALAWIRCRKALYYAMLLGTFMLMTGVARLRYSGRIEIHPERSWNVIDQAGTYVPNWLVKGGRSSAEFVVDTFLPDAIDRFVRPMVNYLGDRPGRFLFCMVVLIVYMKLRGWLLRKTQQPFERFWSPLRGPMDAPAAQPRATDADELCVERVAG